MRRALLLAVVLGACTPAEPKHGPAGQPPVAEVEAPAPTDPLGAASHWYWDLTTANIDAKAVPDGWRVLGDGPLRLQLMRKGVLALDVDVPDSAHHDVGALAVHGDAVYVAHHSGIATGATLTRFATSVGRVEWSTPLQAMGPIEHSKYRNEVQVAIEDGNPVVYGHEALGGYTEIVDAPTGKTIAHGQPPQILVEIDLAFGHEPPAQGPVSIPTKHGGAFVFREAEADGETASVQLVEKDTPIWAAELPGNAFCGRAALRELFGTLWVVRFCAIATGADLVGIDAKTGDVRVSRPLRALPDIGHSEYSAAVQLRDVAGYLVVLGNEAGGRYLEAIHPDSGATVVSRTWK